MKIFASVPTTLPGSRKLISHILTTMAVLRTPRSVVWE